MLNAQSFAVYFKIFGYKADMQFIPDYYWKKKKYSKGYRTQTKNKKLLMKAAFGHRTKR